jgi:very-short-patch-repair endonuclease
MIGLLADRQHGVVATYQLLALGFDYDDICYRVKVGRLHRIHRGVYAVGYRKLTRHGQWMAAVLAYGPSALLSHYTAAALWGIAKTWGKVHVTTPDSRRDRPRISAHTAHLHIEDVAECDGIPVTSVARTTVDVAAGMEDDRLTRLIEDAVRADQFALGALDRAIARRPRAAGIGRLQVILADYRGTVDTRSNHERALRKLIIAAGLPEPQYNVLVEGFLVDACWPGRRLIVEVDSRAYHLTPSAFERDRIRDAQHQKAGYRVLRITEKRLYGDPAGVIADIIALMR